ncbi:MAG: CPBP family glutamic-type intramembrane protease [Terriglobales bacterium]
MTATPSVESPRATFHWPLAVGTLVPFLVAFWFAAYFFHLPERIGGNFPSAFASFVLLFAPFWFFGFGLAEPLARKIRSRWARVLLPGLLVVPYLVFTVPRHEAHAVYLAIFLALPIGLSALMEFAPPNTSAFSWQDAVALILAGAPIDLRLLGNSWPHPGLSAMPKLLLVDTVLYVYLVIRRLPRVGFDFRVRGRDLLIGLREFAFYAPIAIGLGLLMHFIHPNFVRRSAAEIAGAYLVTFFFVAIPEELFFRGLLQNLLEGRLGRTRALLLAATIFGLSHFNKPLPFNWRYVIMAAIAGVFYGRSWLDRRRVASSAVTHSTVDVVWSLWWR